MLAQLTDAHFAPLVGGGFSLAAGGGPDRAAELLSVRLLTASPGAPAPRRGFALSFRVRTPDYLPQGVYAVSHERLGRLDVFLVPVGRDADGLLLEAIFN